MVNGSRDHSPFSFRWRLTVGLYSESNLWQQMFGTVKN